MVISGLCVNCVSKELNAVPCDIVYVVQCCRVKAVVDLGSLGLYVIFDFWVS